MRMRGTVAAVFRPRPMRCLVYLFGLGAVALVLCLPLLVIIGRNPRVLWPVAAAVWVLLLLPVARVRCVVTDDGIAVQNYLRSYWLPWPELTEVKLWPPKVLSLTFFPGQMVPECVARTGRRVQISALTGASVPAGDRFQALVEEKAAVFGFAARVAWGYAARN